VQTNAFVAVRFSFYSVQLVSFLVLIVMTALHAQIVEPPVGMLNNQEVTSGRESGGTFLPNT
jgi:hypothetical protein